MFPGRSGHAGAGPLAKLDPRVKLGTVLLLVVALAVRPTDLALRAYAIALVLAALAAGRPFSVSFGRALLPVVWLGAGLMVFTALVEPESREWIGFIPVSAIGARHGAILALRMVELVGVGIMLAATTSPLAVAAAVQWLLWPLRLLGVEPWVFGLLVTLVLRFVPLLKAEAGVVDLALRLRGITVGRSPVDQVWRLYALSVATLGRLLAAADDLAASLVVRGMLDTPSGPPEFAQLRAGDYLLFVAGAAISATCWYG